MPDAWISSYNITGKYLFTLNFFKKRKEKKKRKEIERQPDMSQSQNNNKKNFNFKIAGVPFKLKTSHGDSTVTELVDYVNAKVTEALAVTKNSSFQNAAVLAAFNIAEEMILLKQRAQAELSKLEVKALKLSLDLENSKTNKSSTY